MSLKAKIEAVIYASEEPVTLAQLAGLLGQEAQVELDRIDSAQHSLQLDEPAEGELPVDLEELNREILAEPEELAEAAPAVEDETSAAVEQPSEPDAVDEKIDEKKAAREEKARAARLRDYFRRLLEELVSDYANGDRGLEIREVAGGYRLATKPEYHDAVRGFVKSLKPPLKLSLQALETLAVVAYKQPVTAPEISEIRGVDSGGVLGSLMARKLVTTAGRKQVIGRPILYKTTRDFLLRFGLKDLNELPSIEEFEKMAGELADVEPVQEEIPMAEASQVQSITGANLEEERAAAEPQGDGDSSELDTVPVDGRISGLPPNYDEVETNAAGGEADSPALDAEIQADAEQAEEGESPEVAQDPRDSPDNPEDHEPDTVATPEGDNEGAPDEPLEPAPAGLQTPRGSTPDEE
jgi:segregation and condensation protein B